MAGPATRVAGGLLAAVLASTFWQAMPQTVTNAASQGTSSSLSIDRFAVIAESARTGAFRAFRELGRLLRVSDDELTHVVGIGRTTPYAWERVGREPRPNTVRRLYQYHALLSALHRQVGEARFSEWLESSRPVPRDLLLAGHLETVARSTQALLFGRSYQPAVGLGAAQDEQVESRALPANPLATNEIRANRRRARQVRV